MQGFSFFSSDGAHVTNQGTDVSWGGGVRAGIEWALAPQFRIGVAGNSRIYTHEFERYRGLFAEQGDFDIPASLQAGIAFDVTPNLTFLADYKHIWYGSVASIANPSTNILSGAALGADNGPGFGWKDIDIFKVGAEWRNLGNLTLRAGYSYNTSPLQSRDVLFNILAPATVQHHITGGFEYAWSKDLSFEVAGAYVPESSISGSHLFTPQTIDLSMTSVGGDGRPQVSLRPGAGSAEIGSRVFQRIAGREGCHEDRHLERLRRLCEAVGPDARIEEG